jgi:hypothetical protein
MGDDKKALMRKIAAKMKVAKIVVTRSVKGRQGDSFVGWSVFSDSLQEDGAGQGKDLTGLVEDDDIRRQGVSLEQAQMMTFIAGRMVDDMAYQKAAAGGLISEAASQDSRMVLRRKYREILRRAVFEADVEEDPEDNS